MSVQPLPKQQYNIPSLKMQRLSIFFLFFVLLSLAFAASPPSFCKCTCFSNSTIIRLGPSNTDTKSHSPSSAPLSPRLSELLGPRAAGNGGSSCNKCNRAFCLAQGIPFCKGVDEKDVFTTCFQRDSRKDQIIVLLFIAATVGLLAWAGIRKLLEKRNTGRAAPAEGFGEYAAVGAR